MTPEEVQFWLEWAGRALLALPSHGLGPAELRAWWPSVAPDATLAYGYNAPRLRPVVPAADEIPWIDEILALPNVCHRITTRRILHARAMVSPLNDRYIYSWAKIARLVHLSPNTVKIEHLRGLGEVIRKTPQEKMWRISNFYSEHTSAPPVSLDTAPA